MQKRNVSFPRSSRRTAIRLRSIRALDSGYSCDDGIAEHVCVRERKWVCMCMCACVHVCMCACVHVCMCACVHVCMCACVHVCMCACVHVCTCARVHVCTCARVHVCTCARVHVCTCARVHVCTCARVHVCTCARVHVCTCARVHVCICGVWYMFLRLYGVGIVRGCDRVVCLGTCIYVRLCVRASAGVCEWLRCVPVCVFLHICVRTRECIYSRTWFMCICLLCVYVRVWMCVRACVCLLSLFISMRRGRNIIGKWTRSIVQNIHIFLLAQVVACLEFHMNRYLTSKGNFLNSTVIVTGNDVVSIYPSSRNSASTSHIEAVAEPHPRHPRRGTIFGYNVSLWKDKWAVYYNTSHHCLFYKIIIYETLLILIYTF